MRNLPVVYIALDASRKPVGLVADEKQAKVVAHRYTVERYEPAVPKCATCEHWESIHDQYDDYKGHVCAITNFEDPLPQDGSGYCCQHSEAKRDP